MGPDAEPPVIIIGRRIYRGVAAYLKLYIGPIAEGVVKVGAGEAETEGEKEERAKTGAEFP